jgi:hypothetical protein
LEKQLAVPKVDLAAMMKSVEFPPQLLRQQAQLERLATLTSLI